MNRLVKVRRKIRKYRRWYIRCAHCGQLMLGAPRFTNGNRDGKTFHGPCLGYLTWRAKAEERLAVLGVVCDIWEVDERTAKGAIENRATSDDERRTTSNRAFRVFYDLEKARDA